MEYNRILTIQDISCIGQCSMTVALPILSACGQETVILPSAVLSSHTGGFTRPAIADLTDHIGPVASHWQRENILFDGVYTGYLGSRKQIRMVEEIFRNLVRPGGKIIVDPAMADHGRLYSGFDQAYAEAMGVLCRRADVILPNITEACMLTGTPYRESIDEPFVLALADKLHAQGIPCVIITGVGYKPEETGVLISTPEGRFHYPHPKIARAYHGTGDIFASVFTGAWIGGKSMKDAVQIAADFVCHSIRNTANDESHWYGVKFETALPWLIGKLYE